MESVSIHDRLDQAQQLIQRLERISADSVWAHRSSGYRGSLLKWIDQAEKSSTAASAHDPALLNHFDVLMDFGLRMLAGAAHEDLRKRGHNR
jgi:hypothetical protein